MAIEGNALIMLDIIKNYRGNGLSCFYVEEDHIEPGEFTFVLEGAVTKRYRFETAMSGADITEILSRLTEMDPDCTELYGAPHSIRYARR